MAINKIVHEAYAIAKDASIDNIKVTLDTSKWSKRKQNIIVRAIDTGVANCGWDTATFVTALTKSYGLGTQRIHMWNQGLSMSMVKPDKVEEVCAYIAAMLKMRQHASEDRYYHTSWSEDRFLEALEDGRIPSDIPIPRTFNKKDSDKFVMDYLKDQDEQEKVIRQNIINDVRSGSKISISFTI
jgi:hypothetical protein